MKKVLMSLGLVVLLGSAAMALTCDAGTHRVCTSGSGRGGGYHSTCSCAPDACNFGYTSYPVGSTVTSYTQYQAVIPDDCSNYAITSTCVGNQTWAPDTQGLFCNNVSPAPTDE